MRVCTTGAIARSMSGHRMFGPAGYACGMFLLMLGCAHQVEDTGRAPWLLSWAPNPEEPIAFVDGQHFMAVLQAFAPPDGLWQVDGEFAPGIEADVGSDQYLFQFEADPAPESTLMFDYGVGSITWTAE